MGDALKTYKAKRNFDITPEPAEGGTDAEADALTFVIQKHWASRLHYDFRLELDGTMKSWAVPKGPSYDTKDKRMAVHVEDHPISYSSFEGTIPEKQYGAGKVIIWDKGTWRPLGDPHQGYRDGNLKFEMHGHKMQGKWVLVRMKRSGEKQEPWLLIKEKDDFARPAMTFSVVDEMPDSVASLPSPGATKPARKSRKTSDEATPSAAAGKKTAGRSRKPAGTSMAAAAGLEKVALPETLSPQLATLVDGPPSDPDAWIYEVKFDGYRLLTRIDGDDIRLYTRNGNDWTHKLPALHKELSGMGLPSGWYDGEIVVNDSNGRPDFGALQLAFDSASASRITYFMFDIAYFDGYDVRRLPLEGRREVLQAALEKSPSETVRFSAELKAPPEEIVAAACKLGLEGVIGKRRGTAYVTRRSPDWIKLKCGQRQEFVIAGYTDPQGSRTGIGSLLLGTYDNAGKDAKLHYAGKVGTGFNKQTLDDLRERLEALATDERPFAESTGIDRTAHWVRPELVAEISFAEWTSAGAVRHSVFHGLRADKKASAVHRELPSHAEEAPAEPVEAVQATGKKKVATKPAGADSADIGEKSARPRKSAAKSSGKGAAKHVAAEPDGDADSTMPATLKVTHGERVIDKQSGTTKIDLVRYYALVSGLMLEHLKGRPVSLVRAPAGVGGELFFQKHSEVNKLPGVNQLDPALDPDHPPMLEVATIQGLLSSAQWNVVEFHTQNAYAKNYEKPNRVVFDLDPGEGVSWAAIREAAQLMRAFLEELGLVPFLKTSGGKGLHVVVPIKPAYDWDTVKAFSQAIVQHMAKTIPERFVVKSGAGNRVGKIFIDYLRNGRGSTTVSAWSARSRPGLGISVPVTWDELASLKSGDHWTVHTVHTRLDVGNEPWADYASSAKSVTAAMKQLGFRPAALKK
jgi:bifunctional non-homologous end joining protein LigD